LLSLGCIEAASGQQEVSRDRIPQIPLQSWIPPKPGIKPSRSSGKQKRAILSATIKSHTKANSKTAAKYNAMNRGNRRQGRCIDFVKHSVNAFEKITHTASSVFPAHLLCAVEQLPQICARTESSGLLAVQNHGVRDGSQLVQCSRKSLQFPNVSEPISLQGSRCSANSMTPSFHSHESACPERSSS